MLNYQSTSFHDANYLRQLLGLKCAPEFEAWLRETGLYDEHNRLVPGHWPASLPKLLAEDLEDGQP